MGEQDGFFDEVSNLGKSRRVFPVVSPPPVEIVGAEPGIQEVAADSARDNLRVGLADAYSIRSTMEVHFLGLVSKHGKYIGVVALGLKFAAHGADQDAALFL